MVSKRKERRHLWWKHEGKYRQSRDNSMQISLANTEELRLLGRQWGGGGGGDEEEEKNGKHLKEIVICLLS